ncbi:MAG: TolC family protein, partial [Lentisphaerae bacterium]|nr:TolC family protein [Lentisphaerota bacterium]
MKPCFYIMVAVGWFCVAASSLSAEPLPPETTRTVLDIESFVQRAARNDTEFETILLDEMALQYKKALTLPADDLVLSVKEEYQAFVSQDRAAGATQVGLSKLFPGTGTGISAAYGTSPSFATDDTASEISFSLSQPIARNAFGRSTRLLDRIIGLEVEVARHQIVEAYEDYLAAVMTAFHEWHEAFENLAIAQSSYEENLKLLDNIRERAKQQVARPIDVNKIDLQVLARKERTIELETRYRERLHAIERIVRHDGRTTLVPQPSQPGHVEE